MRIVPLGGLGEIGLNSMIVEAGGELLLIDAGVMFPPAELPGVDVIVPDFGYLRENAHKLKGILLTHGHEDHVGALPGLLRDLNVPVYGTPFTLRVARARLEEAGLEADLREAGPRAPFKLGEAFTVEPLQVSHSVPDAVGWWIRSPEGAAIHTGDFKIDPTPPDGRTTDLERLEEAGHAGVSCLLSDSTNAEVVEDTGSERRVREAFERLLPQARGRVFISMFASNVQRIRHVLELCARLGRKVALYGRSMGRNVEIAQQIGYLDLPEGLIVPAEEIPRLPREVVTVLCTGSQAEPRSGLHQLLDEARELKVEPGDLVILSSRPIPGNERAVSGLIDQLVTRGATVLHGGNEPDLHVSGHASRNQQRRVLELVKPQVFVPIHGEPRHLHAHLALAREAGLSEDRLLLARDGDVIELEAGRGRKVGEVSHGRHFRDRFGSHELTVDAVKERQRLAETGVVLAAVVINRDTGAIVAGPQLTGSGLSPYEDHLLMHASQEASTALAEISPALRADDAFVKEELARAIRRTFKQHTGKRPAVVPMVVKL